MKNSTPHLVLILILTGINFPIFAQNFITDWTFSAGTTDFDIQIQTAGDVNYSWTTDLSGNSGSGTINQAAYGTVNISGITLISGDILTLELEPSNVRRFGLNFNYRPNIIDISQWGAIPWTDMIQSFFGGVNLDISATDTPDLSNCTNLGVAFRGCTSLNSPNFINWNISNVTNLSSMFNACPSFNQDIGGWDVSNVTFMISMFQDATAFNQNIGSWDVSNVEFMAGMFMGATAFNQDITNWDVSDVTNMRLMFADGNFSQDISSWDVGDVTNMEFMFSGTSIFNRDLSSWNMSKVTRLRSMFEDAAGFNQDLGAWQFPSNLISDQSKLFDNSGMDCTNYSNTLIGWETNNPTITNIDIGALNINYGTEAEAARTALINNQGWTFTGDIAAGMDCLAPLPITWSSNLTARLKGQTVELNFSVSNQINNDYFRIERSADGRHFESLADIPGEINFSSEKKYSVIDKQPRYGTSYYRVQQVDYDGNYSYSNIANIQHKLNDSEMIFYPNPAVGQLFIQSQKALELSIYNGVGEIIERHQLEKGTNEIDISAILPGTYFMKIDNSIVDKIIITN